MHLNKRQAGNLLLLQVGMVLFGGALWFYLELAPHMAASDSPLPLPAEAMPSVMFLLLRLVPAFFIFWAAIALEWLFFRLYFIDDESEH